MANQSRQTAYKVWISQITSSQFITTNDEWEPNYLAIGKNKVSRVNVVASVVLKYQNESGDYLNVTIDDGSSNIRLKSWKDDTKMLSKVEVGDLILVIGRVRKFNDEIYISPEITRRLEDLSFAKLRALELKKLYDNARESKQEDPLILNSEKPYEEELIQDISSSNKRQKMLSVIENLDSENGVDIIDVINNSKFTLSEAQTILHELIRDGEIFEISSNRIKLVK